MQFYKATFRYCSTGKSIVQGSFLCHSSKSFCCINSSGNRTAKLLVGVDWRDSLTGVLDQWQAAVGVSGQAVGIHELPLIEFNDLAVRSYPRSLSGLHADGPLFLVCVEMEVTL